MKVLFFVLAVVSSHSVWASKWRFSAHQGVDHVPFIASAPGVGELRSMIKYGKGEWVVRHLAPLFAAASGRAGLIPEQPLFVGAHFVVERPPATFTNNQLLDPRGIERLSESSIQVSGQTSSSLDFVSRKPIPFGSLTCSNSLHILTWQEALATPGLSEITQIVGGIQPPGARDVTITYQEVFNCDGYFNFTQVLTFYFEEGPQRTRILSLTLTQLRNVGFFVRSAILNQVATDLRTLPGVVESLVAR